MFRGYSDAPTDETIVNRNLQSVDPLIPQRRYRHDRIVREPLFQIFNRNPRRKVFLVDGQNLLSSLNLSEDLQVVCIDGPASIKGQNDEIGICNTLLGLFHALQLNGVRSLSKTRRVHQSYRNPLYV